MVLALLAAVLVTACETAPPVQEMSDARQAIAVARKAGAEELAPYHLNAAEKYLASARDYTEQRAFTRARRDAMQAREKALDALRAAESARQEHD